jgi:hypothetical protein
MDATKANTAAGVRRVLGFDLHGWEQLMLWSLGFAALAAVAVVVTTTAVVTLQKAENSESKAEFERYKLDASEKIETAKAEAAKANLELEKLRAPRSLNFQQRNAISIAISKFSGQQYRITTFWDEKEPLAFAEQVHQTLLLGGWKFLKHGDGGSFLMGALTGIQVWVHPKADSKVLEAAKALVDALNAADGVAVLKEQNPNNTIEQVINLNIGTK